MKSKYLIPVVASILILSMLLSASTPIVSAINVRAFGPKLEVTTIPEDNQVLKKGIIVLDSGPDGTGASRRVDRTWISLIRLLSQHKLLVTYNGQPLFWRIGDAGPIVTCNVLEKDKVNPLDDKFGVPTKQFPQENLVTKLIDVSDKFICKPRWKTPADMPGWFESAGVLDVYYNGPALPTLIADNILVVTVTLVVGRTIIQGTDIQDICLLGFSMSHNTRTITLPDGGEVYISSSNPMGPFVSCEEAAIEQRAFLGLPIQGEVELVGSRHPTRGCRPPFLFLIMFCFPKEL